MGHGRRSELTCRAPGSGRRSWRWLPLGLACLLGAPSPGNADDRDKKSPCPRAEGPSPAVVYPDREWQRISLQDAGIDAAKFRELVATAGIRGSSWGGVPVKSQDWGAVLTRGGYVVASWGDPDFKCQSASLGKNFTYLAVYLAIEDGLIRADDPIYKTWTGEGELSHRHKELHRGHHRKLTWRHILEHRGGFVLEGGHWWRTKTVYHEKIPSWAKWTGDPLADNYAHVAPGTVRHYSSGAYWRLSQALTALWKCDLKELLDERIFRHMGIPSERWEWLTGKTVHDDKEFYPEVPFYGEYLGPPYEIRGVVVRGGPGWVVMSASDLARFGLLIASRGCWSGRRLVSPDYLPNLQYGVGIHAFAGDPETLVSYAKLNTANFPFGGKKIFPEELIVSEAKTRPVPPSDGEDR